jgi:hypothetical protein
MIVNREPGRGPCLCWWSVTRGVGCLVSRDTGGPWCACSVFRVCKHGNTGTHPHPTVFPRVPTVFANTEHTTATHNTTQTPHTMGQAPSPQGPHDGGRFIFISK